MDKNELFTPEKEAAMRAQGLVPKLIWVPNIESAAFKKRIHEDIASLTTSSEEELLEFIEQTADVTE